MERRIKSSDHVPAVRAEAHSDNDMTARCGTCERNADGLKERGWLAPSIETSGTRFAGSPLRHRRGKRAAD
ncbi:unnamed protein product [Lasius platythorax]|uniref:Uncharacterized protein n=1 Tax=Lasius platythorax TaxID=488582 RepID=A0AAV2P371_9HYME